MIAQAGWFNRRKYTGWGLTPKTWQGFAYMGVLVATLGLIQSLPLEMSWKIVATVGVILFIMIDVLQAMAAIKLDEREQKIEILAERNASWTMVGASVVGAIYVTTLGRSMIGAELTPIILAPIILGMIVKGISYFVMEKNGV